MAFLIRTIDFTAAGRELIRDRVVKQTALTIGRAAENDIHLPDLAVEQHHVRIGTRGDGTLDVAALGEEVEKLGADFRYFHPGLSTLPRHAGSGCV